MAEPFNFDDEYKRVLAQEVLPGVAVRILLLVALLRLKREAGRPKNLADIAKLRLLHGGIADV